jgi:tetratricopeptide (TPR) repeat protein
MEDDMAERDFAEIARLSERFNKDPKSRIFVQLADAYRKSNMIDEALDILQKGLVHHPDYPLAHLILGKCFYDKRMFEQAKDSFSKTLGLDPQNIVALRMLAQTCASTKDEQGQINAYKGLIAIDPFDAQAKEKLEELQAKQRTEPLHTVAMAQEYETQGDLHKALDIYEHLLFTDPTDIGLQQKIKQLKEKLSTEKKIEEETGIEDLQVETFFQPDQLETPSGPAQGEPVAPPEQPSNDVMQLEDFLSNDSEPIQTPTPPSSPEPMPQESEEKSGSPDKSDQQSDTAQPLDILQPFGDTPTPPSDKIDILEPTKAADILQPESDQTTSETTLPPLKPEEPPVKEAVPQPTPTTPEPASAIPPLKPEEPSVEPDEAPLPLLKDDDQITPPEPPPAPKKATAEEEIVDLLEPIEETTPVETPQETESVSPPVPEKIDAATTDEPMTPPAPDETKAPAPPETPLPDQTTTIDDTSSPSSPEQPAQPDKSKEKHKEEDFQSFQDWLSGLLK